MKNFLSALFTVATLAFAQHAAALDVFACEPEWGALAQELGGDRVSIYVATNALQDPHQIQAKPSLLARARRAQPGRVHRRGTGDRLAADRAASVGQQRRSAGQARLLRGRRTTCRSSKSRRASTAPRATCTPRAIRTSRPIRAISAAWRPRSRSAWPRSIRPNAAYYQTRYRDFAPRWEAAIKRWEQAGRAAQGRNRRGAAQGLALPRTLAGPARSGRRSNPSRVWSPPPPISPRSWNNCNANRRR